MRIARRLFLLMLRVAEVGLQLVAILSCSVYMAWARRCTRICARAMEVFRLTEVLALV